VLFEPTEEEFHLPTQRYRSDAVTAEIVKFFVMKDEAPGCLLVDKLDQTRFVRIDFDART
jgi:hypothetical protein